MITVTTAQDAEKSSLEVATSARVYDWIHHAVAVAEPEHDLEEQRRHVTRTAQCFCIAAQTQVTSMTQLPEIGAEKKTRSRKLVP